MYNKYYNLNENPFSITPNLDLFCNLQNYENAIELILHSLNEGDGFIKIVGEVGVGKTLLCRKILAILDDSFIPCFIHNPDLSPDSFRQALAIELGLKSNQFNLENSHALLGSINKKLLQIKDDDKKVVVIIDEAQAMSDETLECLRLLTNLEAKNQKLLQVILVGQPELDIRLSKVHLRQLNQRITLSYYLPPLTAEESSIYMSKRLILAGHQHGILFTDKAKKYIQKKTKGIPRLLNIICNKSLIAAYNFESKKVTLSHVKIALKDSKDILKSMKSVNHKEKRMYIAYCAEALLILALLITIFFVL